MTGVVVVEVVIAVVGFVVVVVPGSTLVVVDNGRRRVAKLDLAVSRLRSEPWRFQVLVKLKYTSTSAV